MLSVANMKRHFATHGTDPIEEENWCYVGKETSHPKNLIDSKALLKNKDPLLDPRRQVMCTIC